MVTSAPPPATTVITATTVGARCSSFLSLLRRRPTTGHARSTSVSTVTTKHAASSTPADRTAPVQPSIKPARLGLAARRGLRSLSSPALPTLLLAAAAADKENVPNSPTMAANRVRTPTKPTVMRSPALKRAGTMRGVHDRSRSVSTVSLASLSDVSVPKRGAGYDENAALKSHRVSVASIPEQPEEAAIPPSSFDAKIFGTAPQSSFPPSFPTSPKVASQTSPGTPRRRVPASASNVRSPMRSAPAKLSGIRVGAMASPSTSTPSSSIANPLRRRSPTSKGVGKSTPRSKRTPLSDITQIVLAREYSGSTSTRMVHIERAPALVPLAAPNRPLSSLSSSRRPSLTADTAAPLLRSSRKQPSPSSRPNSPLAAHRAAILSSMLGSTCGSPSVKFTL
ncbi:hypothetical protein THASP1DRAFT_23105 [Thamnocephalis sphaerospora]|uniref:Uncharacterized protein n=1 Tax=Thamnocephalis sphaerospora TaxID=78915 RepID=A0A4V1IWW7_9FUNG|nr:hypothetical protein THASP1DRAFT_23105 [Thamnocephalis sphaerospora]|eukprot:RKP08999.1 hypothetical protein THASP1DRAFT_23105 [Thamnocephalis sphaerospora]